LKNTQDKSSATKGHCAGPNGIIKEEDEDVGKRKD